MYKPFKLSLMITTKCNSRCKYCLYEDKTLILPFDKIVNLVDEAEALGIQSVTITGGEPTLHPDFFRIIDHVTSKNLPIGLISNGFNLDKEKIKRLLDYRIVYPWTSVDSYEKNIHDSMRGEGSYDKALNFIKEIKRINPEQFIGVVSIMTDSNVDSYMQTAKFLLDLGVSEIRVDRAVPKGNAYRNEIEVNNKRYLRLANELLKKYPGKVSPVTGFYHMCPLFNKDRYEINAFSNGKIVQCCFHNDMEIGDMPLKDLLADKNINKMKKRVSKFFRDQADGLFTCVECVKSSHKF